MTAIDDRDLDVLPAEPEPEISRPNTAPAYYLGRPARLWITAFDSSHRRPVMSAPEACGAWGSRR